MYNRYIPQPDGSYRKNRMPEPKRPELTKKRDPVQPHRPIAKEDIPCPLPMKESSHVKKQCHRHQAAQEPGSITDFFKQLLPKDLDTADLMIIILLLLMAGDREEDKNNALLTLALYFFM